MAEDFYWSEDILVPFNLSIKNRPYYIEIIPRTRSKSDLNVFFSQSGMKINRFDVDLPPITRSLDADDLQDFIAAQRKALRKVVELEKKYAGGRLYRGRNPTRMQD